MIIEMLRNALLPLLSDLKLNPKVPDTIDRLHLKFETLEAGNTYDLDDKRAQILIDIGAAKIAGEKR